MAKLSVDRQMLIEARIANEQKSAAVAYALWFFLGIFSAHRFYLGKPMSAVLQILSYFVLIGFIWWLIDAFIIPSMVDQHRAKLRSDMIASHLAMAD
ncbi:MAG: TM2 domain-containing protein [Rhizobiaceae bacterium]|nr:TM2 domain-containing protein [Rhizobiaceae bacterium]